MEAGTPWTCAACGAANAAYRRRCIDCGAKRAAGVRLVEAAPDEVPDEPVPAAEETEVRITDAAPDDAAGVRILGSADVGSVPRARQLPVGRVGPADVPMPALARRPRRAGRGPTIFLVIAVLGLAAYGALTYFGSERPSADDDAAALRAAAPEVFEAADVVVEAPGVSAELLDAELEGPCADRALEGLGPRTDHMTVALDAIDGAAGFVSMQAFDSRSAALDFDDELRAAADAGCGRSFDERVYAVEGRVRVEVAPGPGAEELLAGILDRLEVEG